MGLHELNISAELYPSLELSKANRDHEQKIDFNVTSVNRSVVVREIQHTLNLAQVSLKAVVQSSKLLKNRIYQYIVT